MDNRKMRRAIERASIGFALAGLLAACDTGPSAPAPIVMKGPADGGWSGPPSSYGAPGFSPPSSYSPPPVAYSPPRPGPTISSTPIAPPASASLSGPPPSGPPGREIVVERGQSLGRVAERYHVSERTIIEANHLRPPFTIEIGQRLVVPGGELTPSQQAGAPGRQPDVIPLDGPAPPASPRETLSPPQAALAAPSPAPPPGESSVADEARFDGAPPAAGPAATAPAPPPARGGRFPWPVRGNVVAAYGAGVNGAKNDGINIAAPAGTPVRAIEGGEVAYAGNELKGYGNLVLVKHADGWISAYAHCEELLVRKGDHIAAGQIIAKVGTSGGVGQPQLHFELRRGQRPVDPREFLSPAPSAGKALGAG